MRAGYFKHPVECIFPTGRINFLDNKYTLEFIAVTFYRNILSIIPVCGK